MLAGNYTQWLGPAPGSDAEEPSGAGPLELDAVLDNLSGSGKMMQDITLLRRLWVLIVLLAVILCPYMAWIISRTWLSP